MSKPTEADLIELFRSLDLAVFKIPETTRQEDENGVVTYEDSSGTPQLLMHSSVENELMAWADREGVSK